MISDNTTYTHFHQEGREAIKKEHLKRKFLALLHKQLNYVFRDNYDPNGEMLDDNRNEFFVETLIKNFDEIFKIPIDDYTYDPDETEINYIGLTDKWDYEVVIFQKLYYFICDTPENCEVKLVEDLYDNPEILFTFNPVYVCGCLKEELVEEQAEITLNEPDPETDDVPLYDTDECPCCMEKWGIKETTTFVGNHPTKKILKKTKTFTIKRNTYCGHPICMTCFEKCCAEDDPKCPMCRKKYQDTGDRVEEVVSRNYPISTEIAQDLFRCEDEKLFDFVDINRLINQAVYSDGLEHLFRLEGFSITTEYEGVEYLFGCEDQ